MYIYIYIYIYIHTYIHIYICIYHSAAAILFTPLMLTVPTCPSSHLCSQLRRGGQPLARADSSSHHSHSPPTRAWVVVRTVVAPPLSVVGCGVGGFVRVVVCVWCCSCRVVMGVTCFSCYSAAAILFTPLLFTVLTCLHTSVHSCAAGDNHSLALLACGALFSFGLGEEVRKLNSFLIYIYIHIYIYTYIYIYI